jgi:hypothetical protein
VVPELRGVGRHRELRAVGRSILPVEAPVRDPLAAVLQVILSVTVVGAALPGLLLAVPSTRNSHAGLVLSITLVAATFGLLRLVWPRRR